MTRPRSRSRASRYGPSLVGGLIGTVLIGGVGAGLRGWPRAAVAAAALVAVLVYLAVDSVNERQHRRSIEQDRPCGCPLCGPFDRHR